MLQIRNISFSSSMHTSDKFCFIIKIYYWYLLYQYAHPEHH